VRVSLGFTLIELLVTVAVLGVLMGLAAPSMQTMIQNNRMTSAANDLMYDIAAARSESAKRGQRVVMCKSGGSATACSAGALWRDGWLMYVDANSNNAFDAGETVFRVRQALPDNITVANTGVGNFISMRPIGNVNPLGSFKLCDGRAGNFGRLITIAASGRASVATVACP
jgi:type IV fimbrial biogenesis protein FimT